MTEKEIKSIIDGIDIPAEEDYLSVMEEGACAKWRAAAVEGGSLQSFDGTRLAYHLAIPEDARANVVLVHGLCEFFGKYHEMMWTLYRAGFAVFFLEQRGHGQSEGKLPEPDADLVHIDHYDTYIKDQQIFLRDVVNPRGGGRPMYIYGHSMGGAITALLLESVPGYFSKAVFSSPMFRLKNLNYPLPALSGMSAMTTLLRKKKRPAPGEQHFSPSPAFRGSSAKSKAHYDYVFAQRLADRHKQTNGVTWGWVVASLFACRQLLANAGKITLPVTLMTAGEDHLVDAAGFNAFCAKVPQTRRLHYADARHELFNAAQKERQQFYEDLLRTFLS